jgi:aminomethyltransferase
MLLDSAVAADAGDQLQADRKEIGKITSSVISPRLGRPIALGYVMKEHWEPGTELSLRHSGANIRATVVKLPLPPTSS